MLLNSNSSSHPIFSSLISNIQARKLYEFHQSQNASKANSIHATYLIYGSKTEHKQPESGDTDMDNSVPEPEPLSDYAPTKTVTIVAEENLKGLNYGNT